MSDIDIEYRQTRDVPLASILELYRANEWSSAEKPDDLYAALMNSHSLVTAWHQERLVGLGNAISDGHLVVYYPHLAVLPAYQRCGIGSRIMEIMIEKYRGFHQQALLADHRAVAFYARCGFEPAGSTRPMWIYQGHDHD